MTHITPEELRALAHLVEAFEEALADSTVTASAIEVFTLGSITVVDGAGDKLGELTISEGDVKFRAKGDR